FKSGLVPDWVIQKLMQAPNKKKASMDLFSDTVNSLKDICQGVHIVTIGGVDNLVQYLNAAKLR
ncbi:MAG: methylenetetrahydrofolate reductase, partial [Desulfobacula sp.]|nr:methylenetetrahydrofolate reductase [Desulfobacula sp.]